MTVEQAMHSSALADVLSYRNDDLVAKFTETIAVSDADAHEILIETLRWLWFCANADCEVAITEDLFIIDEMWHQFILMTQPYAEFCERHFGRFLHHEPIGKSHRRAVEQLDHDRKVAHATDEWIKRAMQQDAEYRLLGDDIAHKWHVEFAERYPPATCRALAIDALLARNAEPERAAVSEHTE